MLLLDASEDYLTALRIKKPSEHTVRAYRMDLASIMKRLVVVVGVPVGELTVDALTARNLRRAFADYADGHSKSSTARAWSTWNQLCNHLVVDGVREGNPMAAVPRPRVSPPPPHAFSETDVDRLVDVLKNGRVPARNPWPSRDFAVISLLLVSGLRASEVIGLTLGSIQGPVGSRQISVHGKGDKFRTVPFDERMWPVLTAYLEERWRRFPPAKDTGDPWTAVPPTTVLWVSDKGLPMNYSQLEYLVERAYRAAGINGHRPSGALVHSLRHSFATRAMEYGASAMEVKELLGHASLETTQRYVDARPEHLRSAVASNPLYQNL